MHIVVLMSTYCGEKWVAEQIQSILRQLPPQGRLIIRDDGSTDATVQVIEGIRDARLSLVRGKNIGFAASFFWLLANVPATAEIIMLSDQDDVWLPEKISRACAALRGRTAPTLYFSRLQLVDERLVPIGLTNGWPRGPSFRNALAENIVTGCTVALNRAALALVLDTGDITKVRFHDWWIYLVVSAFGDVIADSTPTILYRQHDGNVIGRGPGWRRYLVNLRYIQKSSWVHVMFSQLLNFRAVHGRALSPERQALMDRYFNPFSRSSVLRLLLTPQRFRQTLVDEVLLRLMLIGEILSGRGLLPAKMR